MTATGANDGFTSAHRASRTPMAGCQLPLPLRAERRLVQPPGSSGERLLPPPLRLCRTCLVCVGSTAEMWDISGSGVRRGEAACEVEEYLGEVHEGSGCE